jgi:DNA ligase D-like protein (predicted ligase)
MKLYKPMLAQSIDVPFSSADWIFEVKWDGIRAISYLDENLSIRSRNQKELLHNFPELEEIRSLARNAVIDGEIILMRDGKADFQILIQRIQRTSLKDIEFMAGKFPATYIVFDILEKDGESLMDKPLIERKKILEETVGEGKYIVHSMFVDEIGEVYYESALQKGVEGIMAKKKLSHYEPGKRSSSWLKIKPLKSCDCVIFGYTEGEGSREKTFGALILGLYDGANPVYVGKVGTGFSDDDLESLLKIFNNLKGGEKHLAGVNAGEKITWLRPELVCEVGYQMVTADGRLRIPTFRGLRVDKTPEECTIGQLR